MGLLDRAIKRGISQGIGKAVGDAVERAAVPKAELLVNRAADKINQAVGSTQQAKPAQAATEQGSVSQAAGSLGGLFGSLGAAAESFANEAAKSMKLCPACGEPAGKEQTFCPKCGARLPEETMAQSAVCSACGRQNLVGTKFCDGCGAKLPGAIAQEQAERARDGEVLARWDELLPQYPKWCFGGWEYSIEQYGGSIMFAAQMESHAAAHSAVLQYRELLAQNGFRQAGEHTDIAHLYKMVDGQCCHCDTEHCFDGNDLNPCLYFSLEEPVGGFYYVKPEPKKQLGLKDLFR